MSSGLICILLLFELVVIIGVAFYLFSLIYSSLSGAPFVPSNNCDVEETLAKANLKKGQIFLELGSGDGRVILHAVTKYHLKGIGVEISPLLLWYSRLVAKLKKINYIEFRQENIYKTDLSKADVIYMFLMPEMLVKLSDKLKKETKRGALIISHGFKLPGFEKYLLNKIQRKVFSSYFYKIC